MSLLAHHMKKDVRHLRWLLGLWVLLVAAEALLIGFGNHADPDNLVAQVAYQMISVLLPLLQFLLTVVMVPLLVQDEPLVGTTAFWFTRPIPRPLLLSSKALFCLLAFVLFPAVVELSVLVLNRIPVEEVMGVAPEILFAALVSIVSVFVLAVLTQNFARFAITGVAILVAFTVASVTISLTMMYLRGAEETLLRTSGTLMLSRSIVSNVLYLAFGVAVIVNQYLTRHTVRSIVLVAVAIAASIAASSAWPIDFMQLPAQPPADTAVDCSTLSMKINDRYVRSSAGVARRGVEAKQNIQTDVSVAGLPASYVADIVETRTRFTPEGEAESSVAATNRRGYSFSSRWTNKQVRELFPNTRVIGPDSTYVGSAEILSLPLPRYMELKDKRGALDGDADIAVFRSVISHAFPLKRGSRFHQGSTEEVIGEVTEVAGGVIIRVRRSTMRQNWARHPKGWRGFGDDMDKHNTCYVLVNRERGEVVMPNDEFNGAFNFAPSSFHLKVNSFRLRYPADRLADTGSSFEIDTNWLAGAELVRVVRERVAECTIPFHFDDFSLVENPKRKTKDEHKHVHVEEADDE